MTRYLAVTREVAGRDPLAWFEAASGERFYWERPTEGLALATRGAAAACLADGPGRFDALDAKAQALLGAIEAVGDAAPAKARPRLVGGFAFDPDHAASGRWQGFPSARFALPEVMLARVDGRCFVTACGRLEARASRDAARRWLEQRIDQTLGEHAPAEPSGEALPAGFQARSDRSAGSFVSGVERALRAIGRGDLEKVVLARSVEVEGSSVFRPGELLRSLRDAYPTCASFAVGRGESVFLGATPERLLARSGDRVETAALAGTAPRGRTPEEDACLARSLLESKKEQAEHAIVVRALRSALAPVCRELAVSEAPGLLQLEGIQHLQTPVRGRLHEPTGLLALAGRLHPTPALGGAPREAALDWLSRHEALARGWYGGGVGNVGADDGELAVALRSALLSGRRAWCAAGAGIVAGSEPEAELRETRLKLRALLAPLLEL